MNVSPAARPGESTSMVPESGPSAARNSSPMLVPDDVLYEVVDGQIKEKALGASEAEIAAIILLGDLSGSHSNDALISMPTTAIPASSVLSRLSDRLSRESRAEVHFDQGTRGLYATDASLYQIEPLGVVVPKTAADVVAIASIAAEEHVPILPRGAATSLSGQTVGPAIVIDFSKYLNRIGIVDRDAMTVRVEPGVVLDQLNAHLKPLGLMFGPDVSTSDRATIGGMIGNNSAGAPLVAIWQDGGPRADGRGSPGRRHAGRVRASFDRAARGLLPAWGCDRRDSSRGSRHGGKA